MHAKRKNTLARITDTAAAWLISLAGLAVIAAMLAMLVLIAAETAPLFMSAGQKEAGGTALPAGVTAGDVAAIGVDGDLLGRVGVAGVLLRDGRAGFALLRDGTAEFFAPAQLDQAPDGAAIKYVDCHAGKKFSVLWDDGTLSLYSMRADFANDAEGALKASPAFIHELSVRLARPENVHGALRVAMARGGKDDYRVVAVYDDGAVVEQTRRPGKGLRAREKGEIASRRASLRSSGGIVSAALNDTGEMLYLGTDGGNVISVDFSGGKGREIAIDTTPVNRNRNPVTALAFLNGGYALALGDTSGAVEVWFPRREGGEFRLRRSARWEPAAAENIAAFAVSGRDRGFFVLGADGGIRWLYSTNAKELLSLPGDEQRAIAVVANARADRLATLHADGSLRLHLMDASHPEAGWSGFFSRLMYEGYEKPAYVWQSTGSDASEPKLSLVPLIWGSVKGAVYALVFAAPIALAAAMYLSQFAGAHWRARLKPAVEMLAAVPSVVIGFLAALWLAPLLERYVRLFAGDIHYDQRNSLVIAIAMGFAVIPTIFSLAEDAISAVPPSLSAASLALGASKWQTVWRVVLPSASPGIFTAVMLGLGRAAGETMIVLMAAGNTPIISLSPFDGMRTLSANIAVEMPEAPVGGTLYRTLFLCALILFAMTLAINTAAEVFRHRLRKRYGRL